MKSIKKKAFILCLACLVGSCKVLVTADIGVSKLDRGGSVEIYILSENETSCINSHSRQNIMWVRCEQHEGKYYDRWVVKSDIQRYDEQVKFDEPITLYYGERGTIIFVVGRKFVSMIPETNVANITMEATIRNDMYTDKTVVVKGVWVNGVPIKESGAVFTLKPLESAIVRLSDVGVAIAVGSGVAPTAVVYDKGES